jgi:ribosome-associated translation inhibitor RaiA
VKTNLSLARHNLMYEFHVKELTQTEALKQITNHAVKEIKTTFGLDTEVEVTIKPETKDKQLFSVCMSVFGAGEHVIVKKEGKQVLAVLKKVKKTVLRKIHRLNKKPFWDPCSKVLAKGRYYF